MSNYNAAQITMIAKTISNATYMSKHGQDCADQYLRHLDEYGVTYATAYDLQREAAHCSSLDEFKIVVADRLNA